MFKLFAYIYIDMHVFILFLVFRFFYCDVSSESEMYVHRFMHSMKTLVLVLVFFIMLL